MNRHPWIFSGAVQALPKLADGEMIEILSATNEVLGKAFYNNGSILARIFSFGNEQIDEAFWEKKLQNAFLLRKHLGLTDNTQTNVYRLVHGEGDGIPGLIIDIFNQSAVIQCHNHGVYRLRNLFAETLKKLYGQRLQVIYDKSSDTMPSKEVFQNSFLLGNEGVTEVVEYGNRFSIDFIEGQKTGFFIDQRENRELLKKYSKDKNVLNTFCYSGGFSVYALQGEAKLVHSVDSSKKAIQLTDSNVLLNGDASRHESFAVDAFDFLKKMGNQYDVIVLDPPAFAKHQSAIKNACMGYQRINQQAIENIKSGGILFTFSCSQAIDKDLFRKVVFAAAAKTGRSVRILQQLSQPADHPINIYHPEGEYLKGLLLFIE